jgi:hypothetical protein
MGTYVKHIEGKLLNCEFRKYDSGEIAGVHLSTLVLYFSVPPSRILPLLRIGCNRILCSVKTGPCRRRIRRIRRLFAPLEISSNLAITRFINLYRHCVDTIIFVSNSMINVRGATGLEIILSSCNIPPLMGFSIHSTAKDVTSSNKSGFNV